MNITSIPVHQGSIAQAYADARAAVEPRFCPASIYTDDRGWSLMNLMQGVLGPDGQVNYAAVYPGTVKAWHRHQLQSDFWLCVEGHIMVGVARDDDGRMWKAVVGDKRPGIVIIPPSLWHGLATVGPETARMFYYVTRAYDPKAPDEDRRSWDSIAGFTWSVEHR